MDAYRVFHLDGADFGRDLNAARIHKTMSKRAIRIDSPTVFIKTQADLEAELARYPQLRFNHWDDGVRKFPARLGVTGLWIDTYLMLKTFLESDNTRLFVFEDDIRLSASFHTLTDLYFREVPAGWDIVSLLTPEDTHCRYGEWLNIAGNRFICHVFQDWSSAAYVVSRKGAEKAIADIEANGIDTPPDFYIFNYRYEGKPVPEFASYNLLPGVYNPARLAPESANSYINQTQLVAG